MRPLMGGRSSIIPTGATNYRLLIVSIFTICQSRPKSVLRTVYVDRNPRLFRLLSTPYCSIAIAFGSQHHDSKTPLSQPSFIPSELMKTSLSWSYVYGAFFYYMERGHALPHTHLNSALSSLSCTLWQNTTPLSKPFT